MRKDYVAVGSEDADRSETAFVEAYWSRQLQPANPGDRRSVTLADEYRLMRPWLASLPAGAHLLDGGCGAGQWTVSLAQEGFDVLGMDLSRELIHMLRERWPALRFEVGDIRATGLPESSLDAYFSWGAFEHFEPGLGGCIAEAGRILKPGGLLFVTVPFHNWRHIIRDAHAVDLGRPETHDSARYRFYQWRLTVGELTRELDMRGFRVRFIRPIAKQEGVYRLMVHDLPWLRAGTLAFAAIRRALTALLPSSWVGHMLFAAAVRRPDA